jgi:uncharacterized membrane protein
MSRVDRTSPPSRDSRQRQFRIVVIVVSVVVAIAGSFAGDARFLERATRGATVTLPVRGHPGAVIAGPDALWVALSDSQEPAGEANDHVRGRDRHQPRHRRR